MDENEVNESDEVSGALLGQIMAVVAAIDGWWAAGKKEANASINSQRSIARCCPSPSTEYSYGD